MHIVMTTKFRKSIINTNNAFITRIQKLFPKMEILAPYLNEFKSRCEVLSLYNTSKNNLLNGDSRK